MTSAPRHRVQAVGPFLPASCSEGRHLRLAARHRGYARRRGRRGAGPHPLAASGFSGRLVADDIIALAVRCYVRYRLSYSEVSAWLAERGVLVDQSTIYRWVQRFLPLFGEVARTHRDPVGPDWRVDETYARIRGRRHYVYRAVDGCGQIVDASQGSHLGLHWRRRS
jgi:DDE domain